MGQNDTTTKLLLEDGPIHGIFHPSKPFLCYFTNMSDSLTLFDTQRFIGDQTAQVDMKIT